MYPSNFSCVYPIADVRHMVRYKLVNQSAQCRCDRVYEPVLLSPTPTGTVGYFVEELAGAFCPIVGSNAVPLYNVIS